MDLQVFVAAHKPYQFPDDPAYLPVQVGRALSEADLGITGDDTGDNISGRNQTYCELTGLYWAWRNTSHEAYGLAHYRRYFAGQAGIASGDELASWLDQADVVVPN
ncbi:MAG: DUF4422 domain-containing protein, partial [Propionibacteriaceae bacterium]|nr:DUF4422 domain-containing protein [Propionibacteriaceae bacterium]